MQQSPKIDWKKCSKAERYQFQHNISSKLGTWLVVPSDLRVSDLRVSDLRVKSLQNSRLDSEIFIFTRENLFKTNFNFACPNQRFC